MPTYHTFKITPDAREALLREGGRLAPICGGRPPHSHLIMILVDRSRRLSALEAQGRPVSPVEPRTAPPATSDQARPPAGPLSDPLRLPSEFPSDAMTEEDLDRALEDVDFDNLGEDDD